MLSKQQRVFEFTALFSAIALVCCFMPLLYTTDYHNFYQWFSSPLSFTNLRGDIEVSVANIDNMHGMSRALADIVFSHKALFPMGTYNFII